MREWFGKMDELRYVCGIFENEVV